MTARTSFRLSPRGHQNSSGTLGITQSAPYSATASRARSVRRLPHRRTWPAARTYASRRSSTTRIRRRRAVDDDDVDARVQMEREVRVEHVAASSSTTSVIETSFIGGRAYRDSSSPSSLSRAPRRARESVEVALKPDDVGVANRDARRTPRPAASTSRCRRTRPPRERAQRIAEAHVDDERPVGAPSLERRVVDDERDGSDRRSVLASSPGARVTYWPSGLSPRARRDALVLPLLERAEREVQDVRRMPVVQRAPAAARRRCATPKLIVIAGIRAVGGLQVRTVRARRIVDRRRAARRARSCARRRTLRRPGRGTKCRLSAKTTPCVAGTAASTLLERAAARHPELVGVGVDHPVRAVLGRREPRHVRAPRSVAHLALAPGSGRRCPSRA